MIARFWSARTPRTNAARYAEHLDANVLPALRALSGYAGAALLQRAVQDRADEVEIVVVTWWESLDAIRAFAGDDLEEAVVTDPAVALLNDYDRRVRHYDVVIRDGAV